MTTLIQEPTIGVDSCTSCGFAIDPKKSFCPRCGHSHADGRRADHQEHREESSTLGNLAGAQHCSEIKRARSAIMVVAVLTILATIFYWYMLDGEIAKVMKNPNMVLDEDVVSNAYLILGVSFALGILFLGLFFWAKYNPFAATLTALVVYVANWLITGAMDPETLSRGILVKVIIVACLVKGVQSGLAYKRLAGHRQYR